MRQVNRMIKSNLFKLFSLIMTGGLCSMFICCQIILYSSEVLAEKANPSINSLLLNDTTPTIVPHLSTTVTLIADSTITPTANELVTFGLPIKEYLLTDTRDIQVTINGVEQPVCVEKTMTWWSSTAIRALKIQMTNVDMTGGKVQVVITNAGRDSTSDLLCQPVTSGWTSGGSDKSEELFPRIFPQHDLSYLAESRIIPPYAPAPVVADDFELFTVAQADGWSKGLDFDSSIGANWLFDRSTAYFKNYMTTGRIDFLKEAILSKQFYFQYVRNDGTPPAPTGGDGCWMYGSVACADGKYIAPQQAKLALALLGDDTQWDNSLILEMAQQADLGWNQYGCSNLPPTDQNFGFTERGCGLVGLAQLIAYEMTGDSGVLKTMNEIISYLQSIQQTAFPWDIANNWLPKSGAFTHDIEVHEGAESVGSAPEDFTDAQGFSPWMSENIADFLWQAYWVTHDGNIPEMLRQLGNAIDLHGFTSVYDAGTGEYQRHAIFTGNSRTQKCNRNRLETELLYFSSGYASDTRRVTGDYWSWYTDNHNIEVILPLAAAYYFETSLANRQRLQARIEKILYGWAHTGCSGVFGNIHRLFNWQHRSNSVRTWDWMKR